MRCIWWRYKEEDVVCLALTDRIGTSGSRECARQRWCCEREELSRATTVAMNFAIAMR